MLTMALAAMAPRAAAAKEQGGVLGAFRLAGSHGFEILGVPYIGSEGQPSGVTLFITKPGESVTYSTPAEVSRTSVKADLGPIGEIDVQLVPTGIEEPARSACSKKTYHYEGAAFEGTIDLHGEEGFTAVEESRTPLLIDPILDLVCAESTGLEVGGHGVHGARLRLRKAGQPRVFMQLNQNRRRGRVSYEAHIEERRGPLRIAPSLSGRLPGRTFTFDDDLTKAEFRPSGPFSGSATYSATAGSGWSGDLAIDFPGRADVPLTGAGFNANLSHAHRTESQIGK
jgi:hypothetical protein